MSHKAMGASSPMRDLPVGCCSCIFCALRHLWRARCSPIFAQSIRTLSTAGIFLAGGGEQPRPPTHPIGVHGSARYIFRGGKACPPPPPPVKLELPLVWAMCHIRVQAKGRWSAKKR